MDFAPEDFALLSDAAYEWLAVLLHLVESGSPWPKDVLHAKAAYLAKDAHNAEDPLAYRVLLILPVLYSRWASVRLEDLRPWGRQWEVDGIVLCVSFDVIAGDVCFFLFHLLAPRVVLSRPHCSL